MKTQTYPTDVTDRQWDCIKDHVPAAKPGGRPRILDMRQVFNAILYVTVRGCQWRMLPRDYPKWQSVYDYFRKWRDDGTWQRMHDTLRAELRRQVGRHKHPTAGCLDSQSVKTSAGPGIRGYDEDLMIDDPFQQPPAALELPDVQLWSVYWTQLERRIAPVFARSDAQARAMAYLAGLLSPIERKNSWQLAEICGDANPYGFQHLLGRADWDPDALRDRLRSYVSDFLLDDDAIGVIDETGFLKKGLHSAGVARQYSGTAGRVENCQIGVFLAYASCHGHTLLDRELYLPKEWTDDRKRCQMAGIPEGRTFATKPALARQMLQRALDAGLRLAYATGDSVYGDDYELRSWLEARKQAYVLARSCDEYVWIGAQQRTITSLLAELPEQGWLQLSAGAGSKGERLYEWQQLILHPPADHAWRRWLLFRRSLSDPSDVAAYSVFAPAHTTLTAHVQVAGKRWTVEESIQCGKGEVGMDHYEVRSWTGWYRHITLSMWAQAFLAVIREESGAQAAPKGLPKSERASSLAGFKARRNLQSS